MGLFLSLFHPLDMFQKSVRCYLIMGAFLIWVFFGGFLWERFLLVGSFGKGVLWKRVLWKGNLLGNWRNNQKYLRLTLYRAARFYFLTKTSSAGGDLYYLSIVHFLSSFTLLYDQFCQLWVIVIAKDTMGVRMEK